MEYTTYLSAEVPSVYSTDLADRAIFWMVSFIII